MSSQSDFVRAMIFDGYIAYIDEDELKRIGNLANNVANNINQIAVRVNSTSKICENDIKGIKDGVEQLWQTLMYFQSQLLRLKRRAHMCALH